MALRSCRIEGSSPIRKRYICSFQRASKSGECLWVLCIIGPTGQLQLKLVWRLYYFGGFVSRVAVGAPKICDSGLGLS